MLMVVGMINIKYCKKCKQPYDIGTNFDICPKCREEELKKGGIKMVKNNCPNCNCELYEDNFCTECWEKVTPVEAGKGIEFLRRIKEEKEDGRKD